MGDKKYPGMHLVSKRAMTITAAQQAESALAERLCLRCSSYVEVHTRENKFFMYCYGCGAIPFSGTAVGVGIPF